MTPARDVVRVLERAFKCPGFDDPCSELTWEPEDGFFPRGFGGPTGEAGDVELVLVLDHPPPPAPADYPARETEPTGFIEWVCRRTYLELSRADTLYHRNLRYILDQCFPGSSLSEQFRRTWITRTILCPEPGDVDEIPTSAAVECRTRFLEPQLDLFRGARVVALGRRTALRLRSHPGLLSGEHPGPPACNRRGVREGWDRLAERFRSRSGGN